MKHTSLSPYSSPYSGNAFVVPQPWPLPDGGALRPRLRSAHHRFADVAANGPIAALAGAAVLLGAAVYCIGPFQTCLVAILLVGGLLLQRLRLSLKAVATAATRISAGDRSVRVPRSGLVGEIEELVRSFNGMAAALDASERERTQVAAGVSHELRTPLTILMGRLHAIRDGVIAGKPGEAERLLHQVEHILRIVDDLDAMAHADNGRLAFEWDYIRLEQVIRPVVADLQPLLARHDLSVEERYQPALVLGDRHRLRQVLTNILTNAAKHSPQGGQIRIALEERDGQAVVTVVDEGPGIAPADLEHVFKPFWRSEASRRRCSGTGIGLALTEKLVHAHGGSVEASNRADRSGACFRVMLPLG